MQASRSETAKDYVEKAEEYYEMAFQEFSKEDGWTDIERIEFLKYLFKALEQQSNMDFWKRR